MAMAYDLVPFQLIMAKLGAAELDVPRVAPRWFTAGDRELKLERHELCLRSISDLLSDKTQPHSSLLTCVAKETLQS